MNIIGVNAGNGVMVHPFKEDLIFNIETRSIYNTPNDIQWRLNFDCTLIKKFVTLPDIDVDVAIGHPDCGHSSMMSLTRIKQFTDPRKNESLISFFTIINSYKPKIWLMENLPKLLETISVENLKQLFPDYRFFIHIGSVSDFGNSQITRKRLIIIGIRDDLRKFKKYIEVYRVNEPKKTKWLLKDLPFDGYIKEDLKEIITLYAGYKLPLSEIKEKWLTEFKGESRWKVIGRNFSTAPGVYRNLANRFPATARKQNRQFNPEGEQMSARELARIQGIPDTFNIWFDENKIKTSINKGRVTVTKCPPYEIGLWFKDIINKLMEKGFFTRA